MALDSSRSSLRKLYKEKTSALADSIYDNPSPTYPEHELKKLGVELGSFDPEDEEFLDSNACLFKLVYLEECNEWSIDRRELGESNRDFQRDWDKDSEPANSLETPSESYIMLARGKDIFYYIEMLYEHKRKRIGRGDFEYFSEIYGWNEIREDNSFDRSVGLFSRNLLRGVPYWGTMSVCEWQDDCDDPETLAPHIMLVIANGAEAKSGELLVGELACLVQAIRNRLEQKEFEGTSFFPVLAVSVFGPCHGRLIQARYTKSGVLNVQVSRCYSFVKKKEAPFDLFLRFYAGDPKGGLELEFYEDTEEATSAEAQAHVAYSPGPGKENVPPKGKGVLSSQ